MNQVVKVSKIGKSALSTDPNDFVFHSSYNTFKIVKEATYSFTIAANTTGEAYGENHGLNFIPMVTAFAKESGISQVIAPNTVNVDLWGSKLGWTSTGLRFNSIRVDGESVAFLIDNTDDASKDITVRYFCFESV